MPLKRSIATLPLLWLCATAIPAGSGRWPNGTSDAVGGDSNATAYGLIDTYDGTNWLSMFDVQAIPDPTHGFVEYVSAEQAQDLGLLRTLGSQVYMGVDTTSVLNPNGTGRKSVRIHSKQAYNQALVIADFAHVPGSNCGSWPAFWMFGPNWPNQGEIDIYEGVHLNTYNQATLHTSPGCVPSVGPGGETGHRVGNADCGAGGGFGGCGVESNSSKSFGTAFNTNGGGVYATLLTNEGIKVWYFASRDVPSNIRYGSPDPRTWGTPIANFGPGCDYGAKFKNLNIVFNITFCGDWAGGVWGQTSCAKVNSSCSAYVASHPQSFADSYWLVNSVKVYSV